MQKRGLALAILLGLVSLAGCVERRMLLTTDPFGAVVFDERNNPVGATPVDRPFTYYGKYRFTVVKDGYQTLVQDVDVQAPWYAWPGLDFISENLVPFTIRDIRRIHFQLQPAQVMAPASVLQQALPLVERGRVTGPPRVENVSPAPTNMTPFMLGTPIAESQLP